MATGIVQNQQRSLNAVSANDICGDPMPLPHPGTQIQLSYPCKAPIEDILKESGHRFDRIEKRRVLASEEVPENSFILGDNLFALKNLVHEQKRATLIYLDPPYATGFDFQSRDLVHSYDDKMDQATWIEFMRRRLILMRECMADNGSIYLHIGHQMVGQTKVLMDEIFGVKNFRNLITRRKCSSKNFTRNQFANLNDYILFYSKSKRYKWNQPGIDPERAWIEREYPKIDQFGRRFKLVPLHAPGTRNGETGRPWRGRLPPPGKHWQYVPSRLDKLESQGDIHWSRNGNPRRKVYWASDKQVALTDYWDKYRDAHHQSIKITGYPTEKNFDMIQVIVQASSEPDDLVIDPFCGSGTTLHAARDLGRRYIGIDASVSAAKATVRRLRHGIEPMGDYVNTDGKSTQSFAFEEESLREAPCEFVVDRGILDVCREEILEISQI